MYMYNPTTELYIWNSKTLLINYTLIKFKKTGHMSSIPNGTKLDIGT